MVVGSILWQAAKLSLAKRWFINRLTDSFVDELTMINLATELFAFGAPPQEGQPAWVQLVPMILIMVMLYAILIRPQQKKAREHSDLLKKLKVGDKVVTSGGILGTVVSLKDKNVAIRSADTKMDILKSAISEVTEKSSS